ncbi:MAG: bifunctional nuclease family protein [Flavobacteriales bacterium AspAUS03]
MELIRLIIRGISHSQMQAGAYALLLEEESGQIKLPIIIGGLEARSIATALEKNTQPPRPFTHDLFVNVSKSFHIQIKSVVIYKLADGIFSSYIIFEGIDGEKQIDSRTSDAIALAIRCEAPIYTTREIFDQAGIYLENIGPLEQEQPTTEVTTQEIQMILHKEGQDLQKMSSKHLETLLKQAVDREHYELAAHIQRELDRRKS